MATLFEQSSDIYVRDRPVRLSERNPDIFKDYAISRDTAISIMPSMEELIVDPTFRRNVKQVLGSLTLIDIKVRGEDGAVLVKDPRSPDSCYQEVDYLAKAAVREVSNRTQAAYRRLMGSPSSSCETSPRRASSPVYDHTAPTAHPYSSHSYHHIPSPTVRPEFYESRIHELESENRELRGRVENLELRSQLERSEQLCRDAMEQLSGAREEISQLRETVAALQAQLKRTEQTLQRTNESLAASILVNLVLATALQGMGGRNAELQSHLEQLQEQHQALGIHSQTHDLILQRAQQLTDATSPTDLISKIEGLQQTIDGVRSELPEAPEHDADLPGAVLALRVAKEEAQQARQLLHEELEALKPQHSDKVAILDRIGVVLDKKGASHESLPELVNALGEDNQRLKQVIAQHVAAQSRLGEILESELTGEQIETVEDLPGAVERALERVEQRAVTATRRADSLQQRVSELTDELRETKSAQKKEIASKQEVIRKLEARVAHAEAELEGQGEHVLDLESQADVLRQECGKLDRDLRETKKQHAEEVSGLKRELQSAQHALAQERETTAALRKEVSVLKQAARETEQRHQEALREQEVAHQQEITPLRKRLEKVTHLNGEQAKRIAALEKDLEAAHEATRVSDQRRQRELREQEEMHQGIVKPLYEEVATLTERVQSLQQQLQNRAVLSQQELEALQEETERLRGLLGEIDSIAQKVPIDREHRSLADELARIAFGTDFQKLEEATLTPQYTQLPGDVQETINALLKQIQALKRNNRTVKELETDIFDLKLQLADQTQRATSTQGSLQSRIDDLEAQKAEVLEGAKRQLAEKDALIDRLRSIISRECSEKTEALQEKDERIKEFETKLRESEDRQKKLLFEFNKQKEELVAERQFKEELDRDVDRLSGDKKRLEQTLAGMRKTIQELEKERGSCKEETEFYSAKYSELFMQNKTLQRQCSCLQDETSQLREILGATLSVPATADLDKFHSAQTDLQGRMDDMTAQIDVLSRQAASVEEARARRLQESQEQVKLLRQEKRELVDQSSKQVAELEKMRAELEKNSKLADEMQQLEGSLQEMKQSLNLKGSTESGFKIFDYFRKEYLSLQKQLESLKDQLVILRKKNLRQEDQISDLTTSMGTSGSELVQANRELSTQISHLKQQISALEKEKTTQLTTLRLENTQLRETLDTHQHSAAEQEELLQRAIAEKAEELQRLQEIEEARRLHELNEQQRQELRAADAGEIMGEIARGMEGSGLKFEDVTGSPMSSWIEEYLQSMETGALPRRHAQKAALEISQLNAKPYPLADLKLFTGFFQVTDHVSELRGSPAFLHLKLNNTILAQLNPEAQEEAIKRIKAENTAIIRDLLNGFFAKVNEVAIESNGLSRFRNIGMQLWIWNTILHGLSTDFYDESGGEKSFKKTRVKTVDLANAEKMRTTVHDLHSRFQEMMRPFVTA